MATVLYRKYRPQKFEEIRGQDHVVTVLQNALKKEEVAHAYLFAGPRGTGKTSMARILANSLGVSGPDLIEIDAASFRGIDKMREIRESVDFRPVQSERKMYILDEAHMLTTEAFNALLKTLEEPPNYVHFVLCTTEPHKIPITVMSRCHRFSFRLASEEELGEFISSLVKSEGAKIDDKSVQILARLARGSYRDAIVLVEQAIGLAGGDKISPIMLERGLGLVQDAQIDELLTLIERKDVQGFLGALQAVGTSKGAHTYILDKLIERVVSRIGGESGDLAEPIGLVRLLDVLLSAKRKMQYLQDPKHALLSEVMKYAYSQSSTDERTSEVKVSTVDAIDTTNSEQETNDDEVLESNGSDVPITDEVTESLESVKLNPSNQFDEVDWVKLMALVKEKKSSVEALLKGGRPQGFDNKGRYVLLFTYTFHKEKIEQAENLAVVEEALSQMLNRKVVVRCILDENGKKKGKLWEDSKSVKVSKEKKDEIKHSKANNRSQGEDLLKLAQDVFGGQLIE